MDNKDKRDPIHDYILNASAEDIDEMILAAGLDPAAEVKWVKDVIQKCLKDPRNGQGFGR